MVYPLTGRLLSRERNDVQDTPQHGGTLDATPTLKPTRYATPLTPRVPDRRIHGDRAAQPCGAGRRGDRERRVPAGGGSVLSGVAKKVLKLDSGELVHL